MLQIASYTGENDDWLDTDLELDVDNLNAQITSLVKRDPLAFLNSMSKRLPQHVIEKISDIPITVSVDETAVTISSV